MTVGVAQRALLIMSDNGDDLGAWQADLSTASYDSISLSVSSQEPISLGLTFSTNGDKMYVVGRGTDRVSQYGLETAWDLSTASYDLVQFAVGTQDNYPESVFFSNDGTKMYIAGSVTGRVYQYTLSTAWDLSSASYDSVSFSVGSQESSTHGLAFSFDGTKMYIVGSATDRVYQYTLSAAWDLSSASYDSVSFSVSPQDSNPTGVKFSYNGLKMYVVGSGNDSIYQYTLSTAWDLSSASYDSVSFSVGAQESSPNDLAFSSDGANMYIVGSDSDIVAQYSF